MSRRHRTRPGAARAWAAALAAWSLAAAVEEPPQLTTVLGMSRIHVGAPIRDDFSGESIDRDLWRVWQEDPDTTRIRIVEGRLVIQAEGRLGYNGLVSRDALPIRDVEMVCMAGVDSTGSGQHPALVHFCGNGPMSPDNWFEVRLQDGGPEATRAAIGVSAAPRWMPEGAGPVSLAVPSGRGVLVRIVSDPAAHLVRGLILVDGSWIQVGQALEIPARDSRIEIKTEGFRDGLGKSTLWFDDCRIYPRPETHYVTVRLQRPGGGHVGEPGDGQPWPLVLRDRSGRTFGPGQVTLELYDGDGITLVDRTHPGDDLRYAVFSLEEAPWDTYPAAAVIRLMVGGIQAGEDLPVHSSGVEGLYPDDVYEITLE